MGGTTEKETIVCVKDTVWREAIKEHTGIPHMLLACNL
jgi:hypothetical protein